MSRIRYAGFGKETTFGTAADATLHVDIASASLDAPSGSIIEYQGGLSRGRRYSKKGFYSPSGNVQFGFDVDTITEILAWTLGGYKFKGGAGNGSKNEHGVWADDSLIPTSFTTRIGKDVFEHVFTGCVVNSLTIDVDSEYCMATVDIVASEDSSGNLKSASELLLSELYPLAFHEVTVASSNNSNFAARVKKLNLEISNSASSDAGKRLGKINPVNIPFGRREINIDLDLFYEDTSELTKFWNKSDDTIIITFDGGTAGSIVMTFPKVVTTEISTQPSGVDEIIQSTTLHAYIEEVARPLGTDATDKISTEMTVLLTNSAPEVQVSSTS